MTFSVAQKSVVSRLTKSSAENAQRRFTSMTPLIQANLNDLNAKCRRYGVDRVEVKWNERFSNFRVEVNGKLGFIAPDRNIAEAFILGMIAMKHK
jgi:hypothetical protein